MPKIIEDIFDINLPADWQRNKERSFNRPDAIWWRARLNERPDVEIGFWIVSRMPNARDKAFAEKLFRGPAQEIPLHKEDEYAFLRYDFPFDFESQIKLIRTQVFAGRTCLVYERLWKRPERVSFEVLVDSTHTGSTVNHFYNAAPEADYEKYLPVALEAFENMRFLVEQ